MLGYLILLFTVVPIVELALLIKIGQFLGVFYTVGIVIVTGVTGAYLAKLQGLITLRRIQEEVNNGRMPADRLFDGVLILCSGLLLLTPGLITDLLGFLGLIPLSRNLFKRWLREKIKDIISEGRVITFHQRF
ncbi:MAG: FxsA family protein [Candidatus Omnitrophica bacterium]|nr:FxsA family protein [Candidatus Omnitrophota bacterium]MCF7909915.1 FxsA family protein [Candidatus Omnitrophota bacterium]